MTLGRSRDVKRVGDGGGGRGGGNWIHWERRREAGKCGSSITGTLSEMTTVTHEEKTLKHGRSGDRKAAGSKRAASFGGYDCLWEIPVAPLNKLTVHMVEIKYVVEELMCFMEEKSLDIWTWSLSSFLSQWKTSRINLERSWSFLQCFPRKIALMKLFVEKIIKILPHQKQMIWKHCLTTVVEYFVTISSKFANNLETSEKYSETIGK